MKRAAVLQSNYIPWKGYFDIIHDVDEFIFYDEIQYTKQNWRNRNKILINGHENWLTIPVGSDIHRPIVDVQIKDCRWQKKHYNTIKMAYHKKPYYKQYDDFFQYVYLEKEWDHLYLLNRYLIEHISKDFLKCNTIFSDSRDYKSQGTKHEKLLSLLKNAQATQYVSGPAAKEYIIESDYKKMGIQLVWKDYSGYPEYPQTNGNFIHNISILDLLFHTGDDAPYYIWGWREDL